MSNWIPILILEERISVNMWPVFREPMYMPALQLKKIRERLGLHSSSFMLEESVIPGMAAVFAQSAVDCLEKGGF